MKSSIKTLLVLVVFTTCRSLAYGQKDDSDLRVREFVVMGYQGLQLELNSKAGPYLGTVLDLLNVSESNKAKMTTELKALSKAYPNIMDFADQVVMLKSTASLIANRQPVDVVVPSGPGIYTGEKIISALEHLTRGMNIQVTLKTGELLKGTFSEYNQKRLWIRGTSRNSVALDDILALEAPQL